MVQLLRQFNQDDGDVFDVNKLESDIDVIMAAINSGLASDNIADLSIITAKIADLAITTAKIADLAITEGKLGDLAVATGKLQNLAVTTGKLADLAVTNAKMAANSVNTTQLVNLAVATAKIVDLAVTTGKIADLAVTEGKIANDAVADVKIGNRTVDQAIATDYANTGQLTQLLSHIVKVLKGIKATTNWYDSPADTLAGLDGRITSLTNGTYTKTNLQTSGQAEIHFDNLTNVPNMADASWKPAVATYLELPITNNIVNDMRVVADDGDGKSAIYRCTATSGAIADQWEKLADLDWTNDHGSLVGLSDDDHTQYLHKDGRRGLTGNLDFAGYEAVNIKIHKSDTEPTSPSSAQMWYDSANKQLKIYKSSEIGWTDISGQGAVPRRVEITATEGQTVFDVGQGGQYSYEVGTKLMQAYVKNADGKYELLDDEDYTETDSETVALDVGASLGDDYLFIWLENTPAVINLAVQKDGTLQINLNADMVDGVHASAINCQYKKSNSTFTNDTTSQAFDDADVTSGSLVVISITGVQPQGVWSVESADGSFTITSTKAESADVTFDYFVLKSGVV